MGNWMTVNIVGTCDEKEVPALKDHINGYKRNDDWDKFHPLCNAGGLCGLGDWGGDEISAIGNLAERDYSVKSVAETLRDIVKVAPSLALKVHCGGDYESKTCVATITVKDGEVTIGDPEVKDLMGIPEGQIKGNLMGHLFGLY